MTAPESLKDAPPERVKLVDCAGRTFEAFVPVPYQNNYKKALSGELAPRQAIKAFCLQCVGYTKADIRECTSFRCPLWKYRPFQKGSGDGDSDVGLQGDGEIPASNREGNDQGGEQAVPCEVGG